MVIKGVWMHGNGFVFVQYCVRELTAWSKLGLWPQYTIPLSTIQQMMAVLKAYCYYPHRSAGKLVPGEGQLVNDGRKVGVSGQEVEGTDGSYSSRILSPPSPLLSHGLLPQRKQAQCQCPLEVHGYKNWSYLKGNGSIYLWKMQNLVWTLKKDLIPVVGNQEVEHRKSKGNINTLKR